MPEKAWGRAWVWAATSTHLHYLAQPYGLHGVQPPFYEKCMLSPLRTQFWCVRRACPRDVRGVSFGLSLTEALRVGFPLCSADQPGALGSMWVKVALGTMLRAEF